MISLENLDCTDDPSSARARALTCLWKGGTWGRHLRKASRLAELRITGLFNLFGAGIWTRNEEWIAYFNGCLVKCVVRVASFGLGFVIYRSIGKSQKTFNEIRYCVV